MVNTALYDNDIFNDLYSANKNPHIKKFSSTTTNTSPEQAKKQLDETQEHFLNMLMTQLKLQDPTDPTDTSEITQLTSQLSLVQQSIETNRKLDQLINALQVSELDRAREYIGQEIYYEVGEKEYYGHPIDFEYIVDVSEESYNDNTRYQLKSIISIFNERNERVFSTTRNSNISKVNSFKWNGEEGDDRKMKKEQRQCPNGRYRIEVDAEIIDMYKSKTTSYSKETDALLLGKKVEASTCKTGVVSEVINKNGKSFLVVDGNQISMKDVVKLKGSSKNKRTNNSYEQNNLNYIGKKVSVSTSGLKVAAGSADIEFSNKISNYGDAMMKVYDKNGDFVAMNYISKKQVKPGNNSYSWNALAALSRDELENYNKDKIKFPLNRLQDGNYTYAIYIENLDSMNKYNKFEEQKPEVTGIVNALERQGNEILITINGKQYPSSQIIKIEEVPTQNIYNDIGSIIGKTIQFNNNIINLNDRNEPSLTFTLDKPEQPDTIYSSAELKIFDLYGNLIDVVKKESQDIFYKDEYKADPNSTTPIKGKNGTDLSPAQLRGENTFKWHAVKNTSTGARFPNGMYKYELYVTEEKQPAPSQKKSLSNKFTKILPPNIIEAKVSEIKIEKGDYTFIVNYTDSDNNNSKTSEIKQPQILTIKS